MALHYITAPNYITVSNYITALRLHDFYDLQFFITVIMAHAVTVVIISPAPIHVPVRKKKLYTKIYEKCQKKRELFKVSIFKINK